MDYRLGYGVSLIIEPHKVCPWSCPHCTSIGKEKRITFETEYGISQLHHLCNIISQYDLTNIEQYGNRAITHIRFGGITCEPTCDPRCAEKTQVVLSYLNETNSYFWVITNMINFPSGEYNEAEIEEYYLKNFGLTHPGINSHFVFRPSIDIDHELAYIYYRMSQGVDEPTAYREYRQMLQNLFKHAIENEYVDQVVLGAVSPISELDTNIEFYRKRYQIPEEFELGLLGLSIYAEDQTDFKDAKNLIGRNATPSGKETCLFVGTRDGKATLYRNIADMAGKQNPCNINDLPEILTGGNASYSAPVQKYISTRLRLEMMLSIFHTKEERLRFLENAIINYQRKSYVKQEAINRYERSIVNEWGETFDKIRWDLFGSLFRIHFPQYFEFNNNHYNPLMSKLVLTETERSLTKEMADLLKLQGKEVNPNILDIAVRMSSVAQTTEMIREDEIANYVRYCYLLLVEIIDQRYSYDLIPEKTEYWPRQIQEFRKVIAAFEELRTMLAHWESLRYSEATNQVGENPMLFYPAFCVTQGKPINVGDGQHLES